jgi:uncharacterized protein YkwD
MLRSHQRRLALTIIGLMLVSACSKSPTAPSESPDLSPPVITAQPRSQSVARGSSATLDVAASGAGTMAFQWYTGAAGETAAPIAGANTSSFTTPALSETTRYWVRVSADGHAVDSATATIAIDAVAPSIVEPPENDTIGTGETAYLFVEVTGSQPLTYQWFRGDAGSTSDPVPGATESGLTTPPLTETTRFWVRVSNPAGSVDSTVATITVTTAPAEPEPAPAPPAPPAPAPAPTPTPTPPPPTPPAPDPAATAFENDVLALVNQHRAAGAMCGSTAYPPALPLSMNENMRTAARGHSQDMATRNYFSHTSLDGRTYLQRMRDAGYNGPGPHGENIAAGYGSAAAAVSGWMSSTGHCQNIMNGGYRVAGVGYAYGAGSTYGNYWTMNFGGH